MNQNQPAQAGSEEVYTAETYGEVTEYKAETFGDNQAGSDTPRTDAEINGRLIVLPCSPIPSDFYDFARQLERELNEARQQLAAKEEALRAIAEIAQPMPEIDQDDHCRLREGMKKIAAKAREALK